MPEGPEAHTVADQLSILEGKYILSIDNVGGERFGNYTTFEFPLKVTRVMAYGKKILIYTDTCVIVTFLAMTGRWSFTEGKYLKVIMEIAEGNQVDDVLYTRNDFNLYYLDKRIFGWIKTFFCQEDLFDQFSDQGPDLLSNPPSRSEYIEKVTSITNPRKQLYKFLLDQSIYSGIGNYLKSEIAYKAGLKLDRYMISLTLEEIKCLWAATLHTIRLSYKCGGLTISDYLPPDGTEGTYPREIYMLDSNKDGVVIKCKYGDDRSCYWSPARQK